MVNKLHPQLLGRSASFNFALSTDFSLQLGTFFPPRREARTVKHSTIKLYLAAVRNLPIFLARRPISRQITSLSRSSDPYSSTTRYSKGFVRHTAYFTSLAGRKVLSNELRGLHFTIDSRAHPSQCCMPCGILAVFIFSYYYNF